MNKKISNYLFSSIFKGTSLIFETILSTFFFNKENNFDVNIIKNRTYGKDKKQKLDIIYPEKNGKFPIIIFIHGGGWVSGDKSHIKRISSEYASNDFTVFNINYRLSPKDKFPAHIEDVATAINWVYKNAEKYNGIKEKIFIAGDSAGAYLSVLYFLLSSNQTLKKDFLPEAKVLDKKNIKGLLLFYGVYEFIKIKSKLPKILMPAFRLTLKIFLGEDKDYQKKLSEKISLLQYIKNDFPPSFISSGLIDPLSNQSLLLIDTLKEKNLKFESLIFPKDRKDGMHAFLNFYKRKTAIEAMEKSIKFMKEIK